MFLNLPAKSIGHIGGGKMDRTGCVDVAVIQSLYRKDEVKDFVAEYGHVIVDECHHIPAPPRSRLYSLEPIGVGTAMVESLTGYVARLAEAHSVSAGDLVGRVLSELADPKDPIITTAAKAFRVGGHGFRACGYVINGVSDRAEK